MVRTLMSSAALTALLAFACSVPSSQTSAPPSTCRIALSGLAPGEAAALREAVPDLELIEVENAEEALQHAGELDAIAAHLLSPELLRAAPRLRWVQAFSAGVDRYVAIPELVANDAIVLTNMAGTHGPAIADHVMAMLLALTRELPSYVRRQDEHRWDRSAGRGQDELLGKTMFVVGLGGIGTEIAQRAHAFGMQVVATTRSRRPPPSYVTRLEPAEAFDELLASADVVAIAVPLTSATRGMFGAAQFARMKRGAYLLNIARGPVVDTDALLAALQSGHLGGAGLDVTDPEPLPADHPLWTLPNVIVTPHVAGRSPGTRARQSALFLENVRRFAAGQELLNVVDKRAGY